MAANRPSRPTRDPKNMLVGLDNITQRNRNFIHADVQNEVETPQVKEPEPTEVIPEVKEEVKPILQAAEAVQKIKQRPGRKKKYTNTKEMIRLNMYFPEENYLFIKKNGWEFNGMNGFVNHLIEEEMKRREE